jgi:hypothetical protein
MSTMTERHRWCLAKIRETFEPELKLETANQFMRQEAVLQTFSAFFKGESSGRLFVFFQEEVVEGVVSSLHAHTYQACSSPTGYFHACYAY